jgi:OMF family outer membrane factor
LPLLSAQGGYARNNAEAKVSIADTFTSLTDSLPIPVEIDPKDLPDALVIQPLEVWSGGVGVQVPLVSVSAWMDVSAARAGEAAARAQSLVSGNSLEANLLRLAISIEALDARVQASGHAAETARLALTRARDRHNVGLGSELDVLAAEAALARRESERVQVEADRDKAGRALGALLGFDHAVRVDLPPDPSLTHEFRELPRPELAVWEAQARQATWARRSAWSRHLPTLSANAMYNTQSVAYPTGETTAWQLGLRANWVLYDGGARYGLSDLARARGGLAAAGLAQARIDLQREREDASAAVGVAAQRLALAETGLAAASAAEAAALRAHEHGLISRAELDQAIDRREEAAVGRAAARAEWLWGRCEQARASGQAPSVALVGAPEAG